MDINKILSEKLKVNEWQINSAVKLFDEGATVPFIARYRKEATGNLTDSLLRELEELLLYYRNLEKRKEVIINSLKEQNAYSDDIKFKIDNALTLKELEAIYRPFRPKKLTRASLAKEKGLLPLAKYILCGKKKDDYESYLNSFVSKEKGVENTQEALNGAKDIISEYFDDDSSLRETIKNYVYNVAKIKSKEIQKDEKDTFKMYKDYEEKVSKIPPHRYLAINRGENLKCLKVKFDYDTSPLFALINQKYINNDFSSLIKDAINDSLKRLILPSIENEIRNDLFLKAEDSSLIIFKKNLKSLLLYPPIKNKIVLGFDPGFRNGNKYALVNKNGVPKEIGVTYITSSNKEEANKSKEELTLFLKNHDIDYIALGNGTGSREAEEILRDIISKNNLKTKIFIVNESGASVYSASKVGEEEFKDLTVEKRSAISLARRLQDPLSELVKIDPSSIGVGEYQHDIDQKRLNEALNKVTIDAVNSVGVNLNNSSPYILNYVSGINKAIANNIYNYIKENGPFTSREEIKKVPKLGPKAFEQSAGFLRIYDGKEILDMTNIHPENYPLAKEIISISKIDLKNDNEDIKKTKLNKLDKEMLKKKFNVGEITYQDILSFLINPLRDIREETKILTLNNEVKEMKDLKIGMILNGTVRNIMSFGMFIDINVHQDGFVHISEISHHFIKDISSLYSINDIVKVKVISLDISNKKIGLSIKQVEEK